uniref:(northern house mosquito) hypothetical protein n=1 Tax=Culex pipiens TaxID=7175 RepID=A0A8D8GMJ0_CULPI
MVTSTICFPRHLIWNPFLHAGTGFVDIRLEGPNNVQLAVVQITFPFLLPFPSPNFPCSLHLFQLHALFSFFYLSKHVLVPFRAVNVVKSFGFVKNLVKLAFLFLVDRADLNAATFAC